VVLGAFKARVAGAEAVIGDVAVDLVDFQVSERLFVAETAVGEDFCGFKGGLFVFLEGLFDSFDQRLQQPVFLPLADGFGADHHLVLAVDGGDADIALDDALAGRHLGAVVVGDVALHFIAATAGARLVFSEEAVDLVAGLEQGFDLLLLALPDRGVVLTLLVFVAVFGQHVPHRLVDLFALLAQVLVGAAPLF
jgi:hypothetical protein